MIGIQKYRWQKHKTTRIQLTETQEYKNTVDRNTILQLIGTQECSWQEHKQFAEKQEYCGQEQKKSADRI